MSALKSLVVIALFGLACVVAQENEFQSNLKKVDVLFAQIEHEIEQERLADKQVVVNHEKRLEEAEAEVVRTNGEWVEADRILKIAENYLKVNNDHKETLDNLYARARDTRNQELSAISALNGNLDDLKQIGGDDRKLGALAPIPSAAAEALQVAIDKVDAASPRKAAIQDAFLQLTRADHRLPTLGTDLGDLKAKVDKEEAQDKARVDAQNAVVKKAEENLAAKTVIERAKHKIWQDAMLERDVAKDALAHTKKEFEKSEASRKQDEELMALVKSKLAEVASARDGITEDLEVGRDSTAIAKLKDLFVKLVDFIDVEEREQKALMLQLEQEMKDAEKIMTQALAAWNAAIAFTAEKFEEMEKAEAEYNAAERSLAIEMSAAVQERRMISTLRETIERFKKLKAMSGACPITDGYYCSNAGQCVEDKCVCNDYHTGESCGICEAGAVMVSGVCKPTTEKTSLLQYSADDITQMLLSVESDRHGERTAGVEGLLSELIAKLDQTQKELEDKRDAALAAYNAAVAAHEAAKKAEAAAKKVYEEKKEEYEMAKAAYEVIRDTYLREHPIRNKERKLTKEMEEKIIELAGRTTERMEAYTRAPKYGEAPESA